MLGHADRGKAVTAMAEALGRFLLSRHDIGRHVADDLRRWEPGLATPLRAGSLRDYSGAPRAPDTTLDCTRLAGLLGEPMPSFSAWLAGRQSSGAACAA